MTPHPTPAIAIGPEVKKAISSTNRSVTEDRENEPKILLNVERISNIRNALEIIKEQIPMTDRELALAMNSSM